ncbi:hypothetical protein [Alkalicoccobacillus murimartini]|uniref:Uncharacterized protein n=1 Tax=Alkalicoccobacillus murimartini TaxID=171685 RepID=A0ABT9YLZ4_9BACI|nr:hypothetical protein [Alkalicoccobacillus murimartini]MDQ0208868.1 hypothetical protein [Alkalicoccobacillus murimartini]
MGKMISGSILIHGAIILFVSRYIFAGVMADGASTGLVMNRLDTEGFPSSLLNLSILTLIIGVVLLIWGLFSRNEKEYA